MEIGQSHIARLVLGYLKGENCSAAFEKFLKTSKHLKQHAPFIKNGKYFATRVGGLTLENIITEYSEISFIVQGKLEQTNYYEENHKMSLVEQLIYIFDQDGHIDGSGKPVLPSNLNTTPQESLPGNSSPESQALPNQYFEECSPIQPDIGNISQILLEKSEFQEKLADAINASRKSDGDECGSKELDSKIKNIIHKAEQDPLFDEILGDIIGSNKDLQQRSTLKSPDITHRSKTSSTPRTRHPNKPTETLSSKQAETAKGAEKTIAPTVPVSNSGANSDVIIFNGNLDSYVGNTAVAAPPPAPQQSQFFLSSNPPGIFVLPPMLAAPNYLILNNQPNPTENVLSNTDIMTMPTVILDEGAAAKQVKETTTQPAKPRKCRTIAPKTDDITVSTGSGDYVAVYKDDGNVIVHNDNSNSELEAAPTTIKSEPAPRMTLRKTLPRQAKMKKIEEEQTTQKQKSPSTPANATKVKKTTPNSGSHVRSLNFTTPTKEDTLRRTKNGSSSGKKKLSSSKKTDESIVIKNSDSTKKNDESNVKNTDSPKKNATKNLFGNDEKPKKSRSAEWDTELRELLIPKICPQYSSDSSDSEEETDEMKKTAMLIEATIKTPVKLPPAEEMDTISCISIDDSPSEKVEPEESDDKNNSKEETVVETTITVEETEVYLRNCNAPPRFKKKCNLSTNPVQKYEVEVTIEREETEIQMNKIIQVTEKSETASKSTSASRKAIVLETPIKKPPKTPGKYELTPFSKALEEQLQGMNLLSLPTPSLPLTPNIPLTPCINLATPTVNNRPTDYSTSSSYYQPSDTEQNKSLELMIEECKRAAEKSEEEDVKNLGNANEMKRIFNENVVGKKNLSLMHRRSSSSSSDSDSSCSSSSSSSSDSNTDCEETLNDDIAPQPAAYSLRKKTSTPKVNEVMDKSLIKITNSNKLVGIEIKHEGGRTEIKTKSSQKMNQSREKSCKVVRKSTPRRRTRASLKTQPLKTNEQISKICVENVENEITDDDFALHLSTDEDTTHKVSAEGGVNKNKEDCVEKPTTDHEAEQLVQGLKERGILLVHNKSPKKSPDLPVEETEDDSKKKLTDIQPTQVIPGNNEVKVSDSSLDLSGNDLDVSFDIQCFEEEDLKIEHIYTRKKLKKIVYDMKLLEKEMKANVYIESLDTEMDRIIKCTPFTMIFDYTPKSIPRRRKSVACPKINNTSENKQKKERRNSLDKKEKTEKLAENKEDAGSKPKPSQKKTDTSKKNSNSKSAIVKKTESNNETKSIKWDGETKDSSVEDKFEQLFSSVLTVDSNSVNTTVVNRQKSDNEKLLNIEAGKSPDLQPSDDELMNYALLGSLREENLESPRGGKKRKYSSSEDGEPSEKKCKTQQQQALLKKIDVDTFLNKVHGNVGRKS